MTIEDWIAKQEIRDVLSRYCRGIDRMDREMVLSVWHEGGTADYLDMYEGSGAGFVDWAWTTHEGMERHSHQITNVLVEVDGLVARSEAYVTVVLWTLPRDGKQSEIVVRSRYLDRWSKRDGRWAIDHRVHVCDTHSLHELRRGIVSGASARDHGDPSYAVLREG